MRKPLINKKRAAALIICIVFVTPVAHAILPAFAAAWLISGTNLLLTDIVMAQVGVIAGWIWYDCNGFSSLTTCKATTPAIDATAVDNVFGKKPIVVKLNPDATRKNPDTKVFNDPASGSRDVTPKSTIAQNSLYTPSSGGWNADAMMYQSMDNPVVTYASPSGATVQKITYLTPSNKLAPGAPYTLYMNWTFTSGAQKDKQFNLYSKTETVPYTCPSGYTLTSGSCNLTTPADVKKPSTTTCEVLYSAGTQTFDFDAANPNCDGLKDSLTSNGTLSSPSSATGEKMSAKPTSNGGFNVCDTQPDGSWKCVQTGPYNSGTGGYPGIGGSSGSGGTPGDTGAGTGSTGGTGSGSGSGAGTGTGTGTSSGGSCGGTSQVKCTIDDSGLDGKTVDTDAPIANVQTAHDGVLGAMQSHMPTPFSWAWAIPVQPVACNAISYNVLSMTFVVDWCKYIHYIQQAISFLAYCFTALHLFKIVTRPARR